MKPAPFQISQINFRRIEVEWDTTHFDDEGSPKDVIAFDMESVKLNTKVHYANPDKDAPPGSSHFLTLHLKVENELTDDRTTKYSPYKLDIEAGTVIKIHQEAESSEALEDLVVINGTSILWAAIREQVCSLTARMPAGLIMLPTVSFQDLQRSEREKGRSGSSEENQQEKKRKKETPSKKK